MNVKESLHIDPSRKGEYAVIVNTAYKNWYRGEWYFLPFREFLEISKASFLMYLRYFLQTTTNEGDINLDEAKSTIKGTLGEYFRQSKFENAINFIRDGEWNELIT